MGLVGPGLRGLMAASAVLGSSESHKIHRMQDFDGQVVQVRTAQTAPPVPGGVEGGPWVVKAGLLGVS